MLLTLKNVLILICVGYAIAQAPADKNANKKTREILEFIGNLPKQGKFLSGQFGGFSKVGFNLAQMEETTNLTGHTPAILGCDYVYGWDHTILPESLFDHACNQHLIDHWNNKGLITVSSHFPNPVSPDGGDVQQRRNLTFIDIINTETVTGQRFQRYMDLIAEGLNDLQQANVTVLYRPFHEMNSKEFWWGNQSVAEFQAVWKYLFNYFTNVRNLHNLLWVYGPYQTQQALVHPALYYPGDDYVDIAALSIFVDNPTTAQGYDEMAAIDKPFAIAALGAHTLNGGVDFSVWPNYIISNMRKTSYFLGWRSYWSPIANKKASQLYNDPHVVNRDQL